MSRYSPKISILIPVYNVEGYLRACLDSILAQSMQEIQVICINDGSTDSSTDILGEYEKLDSRVQVILKDNSGYGHSMNIGLRAAQGEYIGIVEPDDFVEEEMYEALFSSAKKFDADVVKANYYEYSSSPVGQDTVVNMLPGPFDCLVNPKDCLDLFMSHPAIWAGLYKRSFLEQNSIKFNETPGASFQDISFYFIVFALAQRVVQLKQPLLHYRVDNSSSSVKDLAKVYPVCEEYARVDEFLELHPGISSWLKGQEERVKFGGYKWNLNRLTPELQKTFVVRFASDFRQDNERGYLQDEFFTWKDWEYLQMLIQNEVEFCRYYYGAPAQMEKVAWRLKCLVLRIKHVLHLQ